MPRYKTFRTEELEIADLKVEVHRKNVKNLNLRVYPSKREIRVSVPRKVPDSIIKDFLHDKLPWIRKKLAQQQKSPKKKRLDFTNGEKHHVWGKEYELEIMVKNSAPEVFVKTDFLRLQIRPGSDRKKRAAVLKEWYRSQLKQEIPKLIEKWEPVMKVSVAEFGVKDMKTRWGTCNIRDRRIWLNLQLAKKRPELLEYVVVHEMTHLHERLHNKRFYGLMTKFLPNWKALSDELNGKTGMKSC